MEKRIEKENILEKNISKWKYWWKVLNRMNSIMYTYIFITVKFWKKVKKKIYKKNSQKVFKKKVLKNNVRKKIVEKKCREKFFWKKNIDKKLYQNEFYNIYVYFSVYEPMCNLQIRPQLGWPIG